MQPRSPGSSQMVTMGMLCTPFAGAPSSRGQGSKRKVQDGRQQQQQQQQHQQQQELPTQRQQGELPSLSQPPSTDGGKQAGSATVPLSAPQLLPGLTDALQYVQHGLFTRCPDVNRCISTPGSQLQVSGNPTVVKFCSTASPPA